MAKLRVQIKVEVAPGEPWQPTILEHPFVVEGVPEHEVVSILMAAVARILVTPVEASGRQVAPPCPVPMPPAFEGV